VLVAGTPGEEHLYLTDFGVTKRASDTGGLTATGNVVGTVDYAAPEQILGHRIDARVDVYALGCVLYELVSGAVPFPRDTDIAKLFAHVNDAPAALDAVAPAVPAGLAAAVARAMAKDPDDRYPSAGDLARAALEGAEGREYTAPERSVGAGKAAVEGTVPAQARGAAAPADFSTEAATPGEAESGRSMRGLGPVGRRRRALGAVGGLAAIAAGAAAIALTGGGATSSPRAVALKWLNAYNAGDFGKAASYFALEAHWNGKALQTRGELVQMNASYMCALKLGSLTVKSALVTMQTVNIRGPSHDCAGHLDTPDTIVLQVEHGEINTFQLT
jgi:hypothetical protein